MWKTDCGQEEGAASPKDEGKAGLLLGGREVQITSLMPLSAKPTTVQSPGKRDSENSCPPDKFQCEGPGPGLRAGVAEPAGLQSRPWPAQGR